jgi:hypothetical protein
MNPTTGIGYFLAVVAVIAVIGSWYAKRREKDEFKDWL